MKKFVAILMVVMMILAMTACGIVEPFAEDSSKVNESIVTDESSSSTETSTTKPTESSTENSTVESTTKQTETTMAKPTTTQKETTTAKPTTTHTHSWNPVYKTVHHDAVTHTVHHNAEYKEEKTVKSYTVSHKSAKFKDENKTTFDPYDYNYDLNAYNNAVEAFQIKLIESDIESSYSCPAVTHTISAEVYNKVKTQLNFYTADPCEYNTVKTLVKDAYDETVVDKAAYDEKVIDHYECSCGATK